MPVDVTIPTRIRVDPRALTERLGDVEDALGRAAERALAASCEAVQAARGGYVGVRVHRPAFTWFGDGVAAVPPGLRRSVEARVARALADAAERAGVFDRGRAADADAPLPLADRQIAEPYDLTRQYDGLGFYDTPSYQGGNKKPVKIKPKLVRKQVFVWHPVEGIVVSRALFLASYKRAVEQWGIVDLTTFGLIFRVHLQTGYWYKILFFTADRETYRAMAFQPTIGIKLVPDASGVYHASAQGGGLPADTGSMRHFAPAGSAEGERLAAVRLAFADDLRGQFTKVRPPPATAKIDEYNDDINQKVEGELKRIAAGIPAQTVSLVLVAVGGHRTFVPVPQGFEWTGDIPLLPVADEKTVLVPEEEKTDEKKEPGEGGEGDGTGEGGEGGEGGGDGAGKGKGKGKGKGAGTGAGDKGGDGGGRRRGGIVDTGEQGTEQEGALYPWSPSMSDVSARTLVCESFRGEPPVEDLGAAGEPIRRLIDSIAAMLDVKPCRYPGQFCLNAAYTLGARATQVGVYAADDRTPAQSFTRPVGGGRGNMGAAHFVPQASPAVQLLRFLSHVTPYISALSNEIHKAYKDPAVEARLTGPTRGNWASWALQFDGNMVDQMEQSVAHLFVATCRVLLLQMLTSSARNIQTRLDKIDIYASLFESVLLPRLKSIDELMTLRDRLRSARAAHAARYLGTGRAHEFSGIGPDGLPRRTLGPDGRPLYLKDIALQDDRVVGIRDPGGRLWTEPDLDNVILQKRGIAEDIDPVLKQILDLPEIVHRVAANPAGLKDELTAVLKKMQANNTEIAEKTRGEWTYGFKASKIQEGLEGATVPGTSYPLQGIHLQAHEQIGEFFAGDGFYAAGINALFGRTLGRDKVIGFLTFTGLVLLSVVCPELGFVIGVVLAAHDYDKAKERERLYGALWDPDEVLSRAEVEVDLFVAKLGLALSFIPDAPAIVRGAWGGAKAAFRGELRQFARTAAKEALRDAVAAARRRLAENLAVAFAEELVKAEIMDRVVGLVLEPVIDAIDAEARRSGPAGGSAGARQAIRQLAARRAPAALPAPGAQGTASGAAKGGG